MLDYFWEIFIILIFVTITVIKFLLVEHWSDYHYHLYHKISHPPVNSWPPPCALPPALPIRARWKWKFAPGIMAHIYLEVKINFKNISLNNFFDPRPFLYVKMDFKYGRKYKGFSKFIKGNFFRHLFHFFCFIQFFGQNRMNGCDCWGPDGRLDTKIDQFDLWHIYDIYDIYMT